VIERGDQNRLLVVLRNFDPADEPEAILGRVVLLENEIAGALLQLRALLGLFAPPLEVGATGAGQKDGRNDRARPATSPDETRHSDAKFIVESTPRVD